MNRISKFLKFKHFLILLIVVNCQTFSEDNSHSIEQKLPFELSEKSVADLQTEMQSGNYTSKQITQLYIDRIHEIDRGENGLNAVLEINPDAIEIASILDRERMSGKIRGPLHGIPILIKDNIDSGDKMSTSAGSLALKDSKAKQDAFIVNKLREAGAVLLGKTNLSEWANFRSLRSSSGWSSRGGQTRNPYYLDRNPCGSSAGSGVAVSASLCAIAIGTETNGSIVCPSSSNGVVGIKPTVGLWSRSGIIPISKTQDTAGPMARTVADAAALLGPLTGVDDNDDITSESTGKTFTDYTKFLDAEGLKGKKIGILRDAFGINEKVDSIMEKSISILKSKGAEVIDSIKIDNSNKFGSASFALLQFEFKDGLNKYLAGLGSESPIKSLEELINFNEENRDECMPYFEQEILILSEQRESLASEKYKEVLEKVIRLARQEGLDVTLSKFDLDAIVAPTGSPAWPIDLINGDHFSLSSSSPAARSGYPNITVPAGNVNGLPVGISFFSGPYQEPKLISIAYAFEQASNARIVPQLLPTLVIK
jgi:amidase